MNSAIAVGGLAWTASGGEPFHQDVDFLGDFREAQDGACAGALPDDDDLDDDFDDDDFDDEFDDDFDESSDTDDDFDEDLDEKSGDDFDK